MPKSAQRPAAPHPPRPPRAPRVRRSATLATDTSKGPANSPAKAKPRQRDGQRRVLITAGPTYEDLDSVRFLGNRSSGRVGIALARAAARAGHEVTLLLGPVSAPAPSGSRLRVERFRSCEDLRGLLARHAPKCDVLIMAAAVADYRLPARDAVPTGKLNRSGSGLVLRLEATPDLIGERAASKRPGQCFVGFALEPRERLMASARAKLERKRLDFVVANELRTMDAPDIEAVLVGRDGSLVRTPGRVSKSRFATWLVRCLLGPSSARP
jgi:phosphopantothenoylcysteine decarboxylase/phosphopantothenate--cysteine ligase